jgi:hypothetical protein
MKYCLLLFLAVVNYNLAFSQSVRSIRTKAGDDVAQAYSPSGFYRFSQFSEAKLCFKTGDKKTGILFNYNLFSGQMQFISPRGDTLDVAHAADIDSIVFAKNVFLFNDGFMEVIAQNDSLRLLKKVVLKTDVEKIGAYGMPSSTAAINSYTTYSSGSNVYNLVLNQDVILIEHNYWFFLSGKTILKANKTNLLDLLPAQKQANAQSYLKQNKTSFEKENDLKKLMEAI